MISRKEQSSTTRVAQDVAADRRDTRPVYPILPRPEVVLLLDATGHILRASAKYPGEHLDKLSFERGRSAHYVLHPGCVESDCRFVRAWRAAWAAHKSGLPVEWPFVSGANDLDLTLRLQAVSYSFGILFGADVLSYEDCSILFVRDNRTSVADRVSGLQSDSVYPDPAPGIDAPISDT